MTFAAKKAISKKYRRLIDWNQTWKEKFYGRTSLFKFRRSKMPLALRASVVPANRLNHR